MLSVVDPGSPSGDATCKGGTNLLFDQIVPKTGWKWIFWPKEGRASLGTPGTPLLTFITGGSPLGPISVLSSGFDQIKTYLNTHLPSTNLLSFSLSLFFGKSQSIKHNKVPGTRVPSRSVITWVMVLKSESESFDKFDFFWLFEHLSQEVDSVSG